VGAEESKGKDKGRALERGLRCLVRELLVGNAGVGGVFAESGGEVDHVILFLSDRRHVDAIERLFTGPAR